MHGRTGGKQNAMPRRERFDRGGPARNQEKKDRSIRVARAGEMPNARSRLRGGRKREKTNGRCIVASVGKRSINLKGGKPRPVWMEED